jgi:hypothetical protein
MKQEKPQLQSLAFLFCSFFSCCALMAQSQNVDLPIETALKENNLKRGGYTTFEEFLNNAPSITDSFYVELKIRSSKGWEGTTQVIHRLVYRDKKIKRIWGFSDGADIYVFHQVEFFPVTQTGGQFYFVGYDLMDDGGADAAAFAGGLIGGAIYTASQKNKSIGYQIDRITGLAIHPDERAVLEHSRKNHFIIYRRSKKESLKEVVFTINDSLSYSFQPDSYASLTFPPDTPVKICPTPDNTNCINIDFSEDPVSFIKLVLLEDTTQPTIEQVTESKGEFEYYKLEKKQDKRGKQKPISAP